MLKNKRSVIWKISRDEFVKVFYEKETLTEILNYFGLKMHGGNNRTLKERIEYEGLDITILEEKRSIRLKKAFDEGRRFNHNKLEDILIENSTYSKTHYLKLRLIKAGLLENKCLECKLSSEWNGKPLSLHLDHKDGDRTNNLLSNLRLLCPNCHSQTESYCGKAKRKYYQCKKCGKNRSRDSKSGFCFKCSSKEQSTLNRKVKNRPSKEELINLILKKTFLQIGKDYGVSDNTIRKWCKSYNLPYRKKDIKEQREQLEQMIENELILTE